MMSDDLIHALHAQVNAAFEAALKAPSGGALLGECLDIAEFLCLKNTAYGDSALKPLRVFSRASTSEQLRVRIDDKLSRLLRGSAEGEDTIKDLVGYLILLRIEEKAHAQLPSLRPAPHDRGVHGDSEGQNGSREGRDREQGEKSSVDSGSGDRCRSSRSSVSEYPAPEPNLVDIEKDLGMCAVCYAEKKH